MLKKEEVHNIISRLRKLIQGNKKIKDELKDVFTKINQKDFDPNYGYIKTMNILNEQEVEVKELTAELKRLAETKGEKNFKLRDVIERTPEKEKRALIQEIENFIQVDEEVRNQNKINTELINVMMGIRSETIKTAVEVQKSREDGQRSLMLDQEY